jgi:hypothetical protein
MAIPVPDTAVQTDGLDAMTAAFTNPQTNVPPGLQAILDKPYTTSGGLGYFSDIWGILSVEPGAFEFFWDNYAQQINVMKPLWEVLNTQCIGSNTDAIFRFVVSTKTNKPDFEVITDVEPITVYVRWPHTKPLLIQSV